MKHTLILLSYACCLLTASAAVPLRWTVDMKRAQPATFEAYQGETLAFEAALHADGKPFEAPLNYSLFWQTNGMGRLYWEAPCSRGGDIPVAATNVLFATWLPSYDVGAKVYNCFIGSPSNNYHTAFQLRLRPSPGALPNVLPLPTPVIDFAKVRVLNPPWESGGGSFNTNAVRDISREEIAPATNRLYKTLIDAKDGSAKMLPRYLHALDFGDSYPEAAEEYYRSRGDGKTDGGCSAVRDGGYLYRNFDYPFDDRAEFVVRVSSRGGDIPVAAKRFASVGVAQVGTNLTESLVTSGKPSRWYKALPGATVDGINENGVVAEINVVDGDPQTSGWHTTGDLHPLGAIRWILDHATNALHAATYIAANIRFPQGWSQNFHYMVADETATYIVENGTVTDGDEYHEPDEPVTMTNFQLSKFPWDGMGMERFGLLIGGANITNAWYTRAYLRSTNWVSEFKDVEEMEAAKSAWETYPRERLRGHGLWQTVHTSIYDITNLVLRVAVQEIDDWYTFAVPSAGGTDEAKVREIAETVVAPVASSVSGLQSSVSGLQSSKLDKGDVIDPAQAMTNGPAADAKATKDALDARPIRTESPNRFSIVIFGPDGNLMNGAATVEELGVAISEKADRSEIPMIDYTLTNPGMAADAKATGDALDAKQDKLNYLRVWDEVRQCWWIGKMVNGVINWEVE